MGNGNHKQTSLSGLFCEEAWDALANTEGILLHPNEYLEIWNFKDCDEPILREGDLLDEDLDDWLCQHGNHLQPKDKLGREITGGLRLIIQKWPVTMNISSRRRLTFRKEILEKIIDRLHLPHTFPLDFASLEYVSTGFLQIPTATSVNAGLVYQSPNFYESFMTLALSYSPETNVSSGFLGFVVKDAGISQMDPLLNKLKATAVQATHPLLLPAIVHSTWCHILRRDLSGMYDKLRDVQRKTGLMDQYGENKTQQNMAVYHKLHKSLVTQHAYLNTDLANFTAALGNALQAAFVEMGTTLRFQYKKGVGNYDADLRAFVTKMQDMAQVQMQQRDRLFSKIDIQLKVLYNLIQQSDSAVNHSIASNSMQIAAASKRDSTAMKSIAALTMVFLPGTATATIFSMAPFFLSSTDSSVVISSQFWIYWAVTIPLTIIVVTSWLLWLKRNHFLRQREEDEIERDAGFHELSQTEKDE